MMKLQYFALVMIVQFEGYVLLKDSFLENDIRCLDNDIKYRKRPRDIVNVKSQLSIIAINDFNSRKMELTGDVYWIQEWKDSRCSFRPLAGGQGNRLTLYSSKGEMSHSGLKNLWQPDTNVLNAKSISALETINYIKFYGGIESRTRLAITASCPMDLHLFPLDRQVCSLIFQSSAHPNNEVTYTWWNGSDTKLTLVQGLHYQHRMTPELRLLGYRFRTGSSAPDELTGGVYDQLILDLFLERPLGYYIWEVYMPASFIVLMSFTSFWLDRAATPARVSLGVTTVLTITTLMSSANANLPGTAYPKAVGIFLAGCFIFTLMALLEYSVASFLERKQFQEGRHKKGLLVSQNEFKASKIDGSSRIIFPASFILFQIFYWGLCVLCMEELPRDMSLL